LEQRRRERRRVDRHLDARPQLDHGAEMVLVRVREHQTAQILRAALDELEVRHDDVDAGIELALGKGNPEVDHEPLATALWPETVEIAVHADLAEPAEREKDQLAVALRV